MSGIVKSSSLVAADTRPIDLDTNVDLGKDVSLATDLAISNVVLDAPSTSGQFQSGDTDIILRKIRVGTYKMGRDASHEFKSVFSFDPFLEYWKSSFGTNSNMSTFADLLFELDVELLVSTIFSNQGFVKVVVDYNDDYHSDNSDAYELYSRDGFLVDLSNPAIYNFPIKAVIPFNCFSFQSKRHTSRSIAKIHIVQTLDLQNSTVTSPSTTFIFSATPVNFRGYNYRPITLVPQVSLQPHVSYHSSMNSIRLSAPSGYMKQIIRAKDICGFPGLRTTEAWATSKKPLEVLINTPMCGFQPVPMCPLFYLSNMHSFWSGSFRITIIVSASKFHVGSLICVYVPRDTTFSSKHYDGFSYSELDLTTTHTRSFEIRSSFPTRRMPSMGVSRTDFLNSQMGSVVVMVGSPLTCAGSETSEVRVALEISGCDDFDLFVPRLPNALVAANAPVTESKLVKSSSSKSTTSSDLKPQSLNDNVPRSFTCTRNVLDGCAQFQWLGKYTLKDTSLIVPVAPMIGGHTFLSALSDIYTCWKGGLNFLFHCNGTVNARVYFEPSIIPEKLEIYSSKDLTIQASPLALLDSRVNPVIEVSVPFESFYDRLYVQQKDLKSACFNGALKIIGSGTVEVSIASNEDFELEQYNGVQSLASKDDLTPQTEVLDPQGWFPFSKAEDKVCDLIDNCGFDVKSILGDASVVASLVRRISNVLGPVLTGAEYLSEFLTAGFDLFKVFFEIITPSFLVNFGKEFLVDLMPAAGDLAMVALIAFIPVSISYGWTTSFATVAMLSILAAKCIPENSPKFSQIIKLFASKAEPVRQELEPQSDGGDIVEMACSIAALVMPGFFSTNCSFKELCTTFNAAHTSGKNLAATINGVLNKFMDFLAPSVKGELEGLVVLGTINLGEFVAGTQLVDNAVYKARPVDRKVIDFATNLYNQALQIELSQHKISLSPLAMRVLTKSISVAKEEYDRANVNAKRGHTRIDPFHVSICGEPGIGKSTLVAELIRSWASALGREVTNNVWTYDPMCKHFDGMGNQEFVVIDDLHTVLESNHGDEDSALIMKIKSCTEFLPPMASLTEKGRPYTAPFLITTTNISGLPDGSPLRCPEAYLRRRNILVKMWLINGDFSQPRFQLLDQMQHYDEVRIGPVMNKQEFFNLVGNRSIRYFADQRSLIDINERNFPVMEIDNTEMRERAVELITSYDVLQAQTDGDYLKTAKGESFFDTAEKRTLVCDMLSGKQLVNEFVQKIKLTFGGFELVRPLSDRKLGEETLFKLNEIFEREVFFKTLKSHAIVVDGKIEFSPAGKSLMKHMPEDVVEEVIEELKAYKTRVQTWEIEALKESVKEAAILTSTAKRILGILLTGSSIAGFIWWYRSRNPPTTNPFKTLQSAHAQNYDQNMIRRAVKKPIYLTQSRDVHFKDGVVRRKLFIPQRVFTPQAGEVPIEMAENLIYSNLDKVVFDSRRNHAFFVDNKTMLVNRHFINSFPRQLSIGDTIYLMQRARSVVVAAVYFVGVNNDTALIIIKDAIAGIRSRLSMFVTEAELNYAGELSGLLCRYSSNGLANPISLSRTTNTLRFCSPVDSTIGFNDTVKECVGSTFLFIDGFRYVAATKPGDCGAPLVININSPKICGIHSGYSDGTHIAAACLVTRELIEDALLAKVVPDPIDYTLALREEPEVPLTELDKNSLSLYKMVPQATQSGIDVSGLKLKVVDILPPSDGLRVGGKTKLRASVLSGHLTMVPPTKFPSIQSAHDFRLSAEVQEDGVAKDYEPLVDILNKYAKPIKPLPQDLLDLAVEDISTEYMAIDNIIGDYEPLDWEITVNGLDGVPFFDRINVSASPGLPFSKYGFYSKRALFEEIDGVLYPKEDMLSVLTNELDNAVMRGEKLDVVFQEFLKDELLKPSKIFLKPATRGIANPPLHLILVFRKYFLTLIANIMNYNAKGEVSVGMNPMSADEWTHFWDRLNRNSTTGFDADFAAFDSTQHPTTLQAVARIFNNVCGGSSEVQRARDILMSYCYDRVTQVSNVRVKVEQGLASGMPITAVGNSIVNSLYMRVAWLALAEKNSKKNCSLSSFHDNVVMSCYGDDNVVSVKPEVQQWFNLRTIAEFMTQFGITITDGAKNPLEKTQPIMNLADCTFLKRSQFLDKPTGKLRAVLPKEVIFNRLHYTREGHFNSEDLRQRMVSSLDDMFMYGVEAFQLLKGILNCLCRVYEMEPIQRTYAELHRAWLNGQFDLIPQTLVYNYRDVDGVERFELDEQMAPIEMYSSFATIVNGPTNVPLEHETILNRWYFEHKEGEASSSIDLPSDELNYLREEKFKLSIENEDLKKEMGPLLNELGNLRVTNQKLKDNLKRLDYPINEPEGELNATKIRELEDRNLALSYESQSYVKEITSLKNELANVKEKNSELEKSVEDLANAGVELEYFKNEVTSLRHQLKDLKSKQKISGYPQVSFGAANISEKLEVIHNNMLQLNDKIEGKEAIVYPGTGKGKGVSKSGFGPTGGIRGTTTFDVPVTVGASHHTFIGTDFIMNLYLWAFMIINLPKDIGDYWIFPILVGGEFNGRKSSGLFELIVKKGSTLVNATGGWWNGRNVLLPNTVEGRGRMIGPMTVAHYFNISRKRLGGVDYMGPISIEFPYTRNSNGSCACVVSMYSSLGSDRTVIRDTWDSESLVVSHHELRDWIGATKNIAVDWM